jgi:peptidoglycan L-alanyl-D-glutamate endopeptidase CwlK
MDTRSEANLEKVHPDLAKIIRAAAQAPQPFVVTYGIRTVEAEAQACASGHSMTMHSRHLASDDGLCRAVDVTPLVAGEISFAPGREAQVYGWVAQQIKGAALALDLPVEWGGDWETFKDWGHFQLPWSTYP